MVMKALACLFAVAVFLGAQVSPTSQPPASQPQAKPAGVFVLPMKGVLGVEITPRLLAEAVEEADKAGAGQKIVLEIDSQGGLVTSLYRFADALKELRKRHRVIAWVKNARSGAAVLALLSHDIYMAPDAVLGALPDLPGADVDIDQDLLDRFIKDFSACISEASHPPEIMAAMVKKTGCWYLKPDGSSAVEFFAALPAGKDAKQLCAAGQNLSLRPQEALACGVIRGVAATEAELAKQLGLPEWKELSDRGRKAAEQQQELVKQCDQALQRIGARISLYHPSNDVEWCKFRLARLEEILGWTQRCPECTDVKGIDPDRFRSEIKKLQAELDEAKRNEAKRNTPRAD